MGIVYYCMLAIMNELIPSGIKKSRYYGNNTNKLHELQYQMILV